MEGRIWGRSIRSAPNPLRCRSASEEEFVLGQRLVRFLVGLGHTGRDVEVVHEDVLDRDRDDVADADEVAEQRTERCRCVLSCRQLVGSNLAVRALVVPTLASRRSTASSVIGMYPVSWCQAAAFSGFEKKFMNASAPSSVAASMPSSIQIVAPPMRLPTYRYVPVVRHEAGLVREGGVLIEERRVRARVDEHRDLSGKVCVRRAVPVTLETGVGVVALSSEALPPVEVVAACRRTRGTPRSPGRYGRCRRCRAVRPPDQGSARRTTSGSAR